MHKSYYNQIFLIPLLIFLFAGCRLLTGVKSEKTTTSAEKMGFLVSCGEPLNSEDELPIPDQMPELIGGLENFYKKVEEEMKKPGSLQDEGRVFIEFIVTENGDFTNLSIRKGVNPEADAEVIRVFKKINPKFIPAVTDNNKVKARMMLPFIFKL